LKIDSGKKPVLIITEKSTGSERIHSGKNSDCPFGIFCYYYLSYIQGSGHMKTKYFINLTIFILSALIILNLYQYKKITDLEIQAGSEFQQTVRDSIFLLENDADPNLWIKILKEEDGEFTFATHLGELSILSRQYHMMNGKISTLGEVWDQLADHYKDLAFDIKNGKDYTQIEEQINKDREFLVMLLNDIDSISGENEKRYYSEFSDSESKTSNLVWREYKKYEER
jgi:hypothetical protein